MTDKPRYLYNSAENQGELMHQINLSDQLFKEAERRASEAGFASVDEYIADVISQALIDENASLDHLFTSERLAHIDKAAADIDVGKFYTREQVDAKLAKVRAEWIQKNQP